MKLLAVPLGLAVLALWLMAFIHVWSLRTAVDGRITTIGYRRASSRVEYTRANNPREFSIEVGKQSVFAVLFTGAGAYVIWMGVRFAKRTRPLQHAIDDLRAACRDEPELPGWRKDPPDT
jgi:hypothetical protein